MADLEADNIVSEQQERPAGRREFITRLGSAGLGVAAGALIAGCGGGGGGFGGNNSSANAGTTNNDPAILGAAATAEALATTMYYNIINTTGSIFNTGNPNISGNAPDKAYLVAGYEQELNHYNALKSFAPSITAATNFHFPTNMFTDAATTVNTLVYLEDAFIAAYLIGIQQLTPANQIVAAQIMGVECEHRALARVIATDLGLAGVTGIAGSEAVQPPSATSNNLAYERRFDAVFNNNINNVVTALTPFLTGDATHTVVVNFGTAMTTGGGSAGQTAVTLNQTAPNAPTS